MEFWGAEVKVGEPLLVSPGEERLLHLSQACLGESKSKGSEQVYLYVKGGNQKLALGTLSSEKFPQVSFDLVFDKEFELSHTGKNGSVYFMGYKSLFPDDATDKSSGTDSEEDLPLAPMDNGKTETQTKKDAKPEASGTQRKVKIVEPNIGSSNSVIDRKKDDDTSDEEDEESSNDENASGDEESGSDDENEEDGEGTDDEETDNSSSEDEQTPQKKAEASKKRPLESASKTPAPDKKAKFVTPQKTDGKKGVVHVATPHPSKKSGKGPAANDQTKQQTPKSAGGAFPCKPCNRSFGSENALQSHTKAKHSAEK